MKVLKFGGSSVANADNIEHIIDILKSYLERGQKIAVVFSAFQGVTDELITLSKQAVAKNESYLNKIYDLRLRHFETINLLNQSEHQAIKVIEKTSVLFDELKDILHGVYLLKELTPRIMDNILSFGERLSCLIISKSMKNRGINCEFLDSSKLIKTDSRFGNARVIFEITNKNIQNYFKEHTGTQIITGFIASNNENEITTLGRGGSDYTASIFAAALKTKEIEIWTDVNGIMTADPHKVMNALPLRAVTYQEAMEMSHFGAKVIYPLTMQPALNENIKIRIRNTFNPQFKGTLILKKEPSIGFNAKGISSVDNITLLRIEGSALVGNEKVVSRIFKVLANSKINTMLVTQGSSGISICIAVLPQFGALAKKIIEHEFRLEILDGVINNVTAEENLSMIAVVGEDMYHTVGIAGKVFQALGKNGVNIIAIAQGSSERNISFIIKGEQLIKALNTLHNTLFLSEKKILNLFLVGPGLVGKALIKYIRQKQQFTEGYLHTELKLIGIANSKKMLFNTSGIDYQKWRQELHASSEVSDIKIFINKMNELNLANSIFIDCTANTTAVPYYNDILNSSISVVTPNKIANTGNYADYKKLRDAAYKHNVQFRYSTNVGAGLPIINILRDQVLCGEEILKIEGILSGTLSYLFNSFKKGEKFSEIVKQAKEQGFTEPDPREDLNGLDAARKLLILIREIGVKFELKDIEIENLVPPKARDVNSIDEFFKILEGEDFLFETKIKNASASNKVLRYIAKYENGKAKVGLEEVGVEHPFYNLSGDENIVAITTKNYLTQPLIVKGKGAGAEFTASGIFSDILRISNYLDGQNG